MKSGRNDFDLYLYSMVSVVLSTYNQPIWLYLVLEGYACQTYTGFEIIVADDGSDDRTRHMIEGIRPLLPYSLKHVWHKDDGFRKCTILNKAIGVCSGDYIVFSDGDVIPRKDFLEQHMKYRKKGRFLSGGIVRLPASLSEKITAEVIRNGLCFDRDWLIANGLIHSFKNNKLTAHGFTEWFLNRFTPTKATWNGHNASGWTRDILAVNGFDERMKYGGEDREFGERLMRLGVRGRQIRYSAVAVHLDHGRAYVSREGIEENLRIRKENSKSGLIRTKNGITNYNLI